LSVFKISPENSVGVPIRPLMQYVRNRRTIPSTENRLFFHKKRKVRLLVPPNNLVNG